MTFVWTIMTLIAWMIRLLPIWKTMTIYWNRKVRSCAIELRVLTEHAVVETNNTYNLHVTRPCSFGMSSSCAHVSKNLREVNYLGTRQITIKIMYQFNFFPNLTGYSIELLGFRKALHTKFVSMPTCRSIARGNKVLDLLNKSNFFQISLAFL